MIKKCLFPAAGFGTRFLPATKAVPKEMLPVLTKPLLQYGVEEALAAGISNMAIVTGRGKRAIEDHFDDVVELEHQLKNSNKLHYLASIKSVVDAATFTYVRQQRMLGLGNAVLSGEPLIGNEAFAVLLADDLCTNGTSAGVLSQMIEIYQQYQCSVVAIVEVEAQNVNKYGIIDGKLIDDNGIYRIKTMVEKPSVDKSPSNLAIIGRYILTPDIFSILANTKADKNGEIQITDALKQQAKRGKVIGVKFRGTRFDCGSVEGYLQANNYFAKLIV